MDISETSHGQIVNYLKTYKIPEKVRKNSKLNIKLCKEYKDFTTK